MTTVNTDAKGDKKEIRRKRMLMEMTIEERERALLAVLCKMNEFRRQGRYKKHKHSIRPD